MNLFSGTITTLEQALKYSSTKQKAISENIANIDTPNYKAKEVRFKSILNETLSQSMVANKTNQKHIDFINKYNQSLATIHRNNVSYNENGNSVDIDKEMADLASNQIYYNAVIERISGKFSTLQNVIRGGK